MRQRLRVPSLLLGVLLSLGFVLGCGDAPSPPDPKDTGRPGAMGPTTGRPSEQPHRKSRPKAPALASGADVSAFVDWAGAATVRDDDAVRKAVAAAAGNEAVVKGLIGEARQAVEGNHSRALVSLGLLGEMRTDEGARYFLELIATEPPERDTLIEGFPVRGTALAQLQAKAVDGLAYQRSEASDREVLRIAAKHPHAAVRAEAVRAYLWNHDDSREARVALAEVLRENEQHFVDRPHRTATDDKASFNKRLDTYLRAHPDRVAPDPKRRTTGKPVPDDTKTTYDEVPPDP